MVVGWGLSCKPITLTLYSNFQLFVTVVTGDGLRCIALLHSLTPEQPLGYFVMNRGRICYTKVELWRIFCLNFQIFVTMATGSSEKSLTDSIKLTDPENTLLGASIWRYQLHKLHVSYSRFCVENCKFSLPWQQGYVRAKCD